MTYVDKQPNSKVLVHLLLLLESHGEILPTRFLVINTEHKIFLPGTSALALGVMQINQTCEEKQINQDDSKQNDKEIIEDFTNEPTPIDKPLSHSTQR